MVDDDEPFRSGVARRGSPSRAVDRRGRGRREAALLAAWSVLAAVFVVSALRLGNALWAGILGPAVMGGLIVLVVLSAVGRARTRTVRPRHFNLVEGVSALWAAVGTGIAIQSLGAAQGRQVPMEAAVVAALVLTAPLFGCAIWLAVRSR